MTTLTITTNRPELFLQGGGTTGGKRKRKKVGYKWKLRKKKSSGKGSMYQQGELFDNRTLFTNQATNVFKDGKNYLVVPGVPVQEQVMNTYLLPASEIHPEDWNGTPLSIRHAQKNNGSVQVDNPDVPIIGYLANTSWDEDKKRMLGDYWIDEAEAMRHPEGQVILSSIKNGSMLETSTAYWADEQYVSGVFNGKKYDTIHRNPKRDHIAIFPDNQTGACSIRDGCGVNRNMAHNCGQCDDLHQQGAAHPWHKGRPGEKGGSTSTAPGRAKEASAKADRATKLAMETRTPEAYATARDYHLRAAKANFEAYRDVQQESPEAAASYKRAVAEHEGTAEILERRIKKNGLQYDRLFLNMMGNLPAEGKALWEKVYNANKEKMGEESAAKMAWGACEKAGWKKKGEEWVKSNDEHCGYKPGHLPTELLIGYSLNKGSRTQVELDAMREQVREHGVTKPVWVQCNGSIKILDGNHRVQLAHEFDIEQVPVKVVDSNLMPMDPEAVYRKWLHEQDQGYLT